METEFSFLRQYSFKKYEELIDECIEYIKPLLIHEPELKVYGKVVHQRRNIGFFSDESIGYTYSKKLMPSQPLNRSLKKLIKKVNKKFNAEFNGILVNEYLTGENYISAHSDDETALDNSGVIAISYGATRTFRIREKKSKKIVLDIPMEHMDILIMGGDFQKEFTHEIPKEKKVKESRISLTFRRHMI